MTPARVDEREQTVWLESPMVPAGSPGSAQSPQLLSRSSRAVFAVLVLLPGTFLQVTLEVERREALQ